MAFSVEQNPHAKLTKELVLEIKSKIKQGVSGVELAREYGISTSAISRIKRNVTWRNYEDRN